MIWALFGRRSGTAIVAAGLMAIAAAQSSVPSDIRLHAIVGARIEVGDGRVIVKGNVVIRSGTIVAVGADAAVPAGADIVDGKGLTVYPGFIDAYTTKAVKSPDAEPAQDIPAPVGEFASAFMREANRRGIRPQFQARQGLMLDDGFLRPYWNSGFATANVVPPGGMMSGQSALVNLSGRPARESVVVPEFALSLSFDGQDSFAAGTYPGSLMGRVAQVRQAFLDAQWYRDVARSFLAGGEARPPSDVALEALQPILAKTMPTTIEADTAAQIDRALRVAREFGLKPILVGGQEAFRRLEAIKASGAPILLGIHFGNEPGGDAPPKPDPMKPDAMKTDVVKPDAPKTEPAKTSEGAPLPDPPDRLAERKRLYDQSLRNVQEVGKAGIPFAFSSRGAENPKDFMDSVRKLVKAGLPRDAALRALTLDAANILGIGRQFGTVEAGKVANIAVMTGDFLDEKTTVKILYVDGRKIDPARTTDAPTPSRPQFGGEVGR